MSKYAKLDNNNDRKMAFGSFNDGVDSAHNGVGVVQISQTFVMQDAYFLRTLLFDRPYQLIRESRCLQ